MSVIRCLQTFSRNVLLIAIVRSVQEQDINGKQSAEKARACGCYDGTKKSFEIACGNITGSQRLREYGLYSLEIILTCLVKLFDTLHLDTCDDVTILHQGNHLITLSNKTSKKICLKSITLDICDVMEKASSLSKTFQDELQLEAEKSSTQEIIPPSLSNNFQEKPQLEADKFSSQEIIKPRGCIGAQLANPTVVAVAISLTFLAFAFWCNGRWKI